MKNDYTKHNLGRLLWFVFICLYVFAPLNYILKTEKVYTFANESTSSVTSGGDGPAHVPTPTPEATETPQNDPEAPSDPVEVYIFHKFGEDAENGIKMLRKCENSTLDPDAINWNKNGTWDYGLWMINEVHGYTQEELSDPYFNTDVAYKIYKQGNNSFYFWTCGHIAGDETYLSD